MGLDMYLYAQQYVGGWEHQPETERAAFRAIRAAAGLTRLPVPTWSPHLTVDACVAYWRKANAIHAWFVDNVQDGRDECQRSYVSHEQLRTLHSLAAEAAGHFRAGHPTKAAELLPPRSGFFFGSTDLDADYLSDLDATVTQLAHLLAPELDAFEFYYRSSW